MCLVYSLLVLPLLKYEFDKEARTKAGLEFEKTITPELIAYGKSLYDTNCGNCHGLDGKKVYEKGEKPIAGKTPAKMYGYLLKYKAMADSGKTYPETVQSMLTPMKNLNDQQMRAIVAYTTTFTKKKNK